MQSMKRAIITGITGQDGSYLADLLLANKYKVYGIYRRTSNSNFSRLTDDCLKNKNFHLLEGDICDPYTVARILKIIKPDEYYNLAAQSHVATSFEQPSYTWDATAKGVLNALEAIRNESADTKFYQASSSEMFGKNYTTVYDDFGENPLKFQNEETAFYPQSPYAIAKLAGHHLVRNYRDSYNIFACSGILFNHESERRGENFVTRKITKWLGEFIASEKDKKFPKLRLGNLDAHRDWGHAQDYVKAMWLMLQQENPDDYVVATGNTYTIKEFLEVAFSRYDLNWEKHVVIDPKFYRPAEVEFLRGSPKKAKEKLKWSPEISFYSLVERMVEHDVAEARLQRSTLQEV
jgi:GDPmannose 4,6-dehydratase